MGRFLYFILYGEHFEPRLALKCNGPSKIKLLKFSRNHKLLSGGGKNEIPDRMTSAGACPMLSRAPRSVKRRASPRARLEAVGGGIRAELLRGHRT